MTTAETVDSLVAAIPGDVPVGEDPRNSEEFEAIGNELAKIGGVALEPVNWTAVLRNSDHLLREVGKDLRCAVYWCIGTMCTGGLENLGLGVSLLSRLIETYGSDVHPKRPRARASILSWFAERVDLELEAGSLAFTRDERVALFDRLESFRRALLDIEVDVSALQRVQSAVDSHASIALSSDEQEAQVRSRFSPEFAELAVQMLDHPSVAANTPLGLRVRRWVLWESVPEAADRIYDFTLPAEQAETLRKHFSDRQWADLLDSAEAVFSGTPLWLDLTFFTAHAARQLHGEATSQGVIATLRDLIARAPELVDGKDAAGSPLASEDVREWIEREVVGVQAARVEAMEALPPEVQEHMDENRLKEAFSAASQWIAHPEGRVSFARSVTLAHAFGAKGSAVNAHVVFRGLHSHLRQMSVKEWDPPIFTACITGYLSTKRDAYGLGPEDEPLMDELSALDPAALMSILPP